jgi:hypothetical protein
MVDRFFARLPSPIGYLIAVGICGFALHFALTTV